MINVLIADDHTIVRKGLRQIVADTQDITVKGEADNGEEVLLMLEKADYDVVLLDITMPGRSGIDVLYEIKRSRPELPVLILSVHPEEQYAKRVLKAGASGYLTKESAAEELVAAIRRVAGGGKYVSTTLAEILALDLMSPGSSDGGYERLSNREFEVMIMLASGKSAREIGEQLFLSVKTVHTYRTRIMKKLNFTNIAELVRYVIENELLD